MNLLPLMMRAINHQLLSSPNRLNDGREDALNFILLGIANRITSVSQMKQLTDLVGIYDIDEATANEIDEITEDNLVWLTTYSDNIQDFLDDFLRSDSSTSRTVSCLALISCFSLNWVMQN